jgi:hypothetical protein
MKSYSFLKNDFLRQSNLRNKKKEGGQELNSQPYGWTELYHISMSA